MNQLPIGALQPTITVKVGQTTDAMYLGFAATALAGNQITDYLTRVVVPKLQAVDGRANRRDASARRPFRCAPGSIPEKLAGYGLTASDVSAALAANDYISAVGNTKGQMVQVTLTSTSNLHSLDEFRDLVVKQVNGANIRLERCRRG